MIGTLTHNSTFSKPFKVGGTNAQHTIGSVCGDGDVVSVLFLEPENLSRFANSRVTQVPNHTNPANSRATRNKINTDTKPHALPEQVIAESGQAARDAPFKSTAGRNPWELMVFFRKVALLKPADSGVPVGDDFNLFAHDVEFSGHQF